MEASYINKMQDNNYTLTQFGGLHVYYNYFVCPSLCPSVRPPARTLWVILYDICTTVMIHPDLWFPFVIFYDICTKVMIHPAHVLLTPYQMCANRVD